MAQSPSHTFGQIIGDLLEASVIPFLLEIAEQHNLFLDSKGIRGTRGQSSKIRWTDINGNSHDLDIVIERGGTDTTVGKPVAFIETAWRRYTKHSKNKAQEIEGAILPLSEMYSEQKPFIGAILAGEFTANSLRQLESRGFRILYFPLETVIDAFRDVGIDASFGEESTDQEIQAKIDIWKSLRNEHKQQVAYNLIALNLPSVLRFQAALDSSFRRRIERVLVMPLHGREKVFESAATAISFLADHEEIQTNYPFVRYEIRIVWSNGDHIDGVFAEKANALQFLSDLV